MENVAFRTNVIPRKMAIYSAEIFVKGEIRGRVDDDGNIGVVQRNSYLIVFECSLENGEEIVSAIESVSKNDYCSAIQLYDAIISATKDIDNFNTIRVETKETLVKDGNMRHSSVAYANGSLQNILITESFVGKGNDNGVWNLNRDSTWKYSTKKFSIKGDAKQETIEASFNVRLQNVRECMAEIESSIHDKSFEAKCLLKKFFK